MSARKAKVRLLVADRALADLAEIEAYSVAQWGRSTAARYISDIEAALARLQEEPDLLRPEDAFHPRLRFYRAHKHLLVCDVQPHAIFLLTIVHASRDIPSRLAELEPSLANETELLHEKLRRSRDG